MNKILENKDIKATQWGSVEFTWESTENVTTTKHNNKTLSLSNWSYWSQFSSSPAELHSRDAFGWL